MRVKVRSLAFFWPVCLTVRLLVLAFTDTTSPAMCFTPAASFSTCPEYTEGKRGTAWKSLGGLRRNAAAAA
jgi:hypothetical protein